jgi:molybdopterin-binding protein
LPNWRGGDGWIASSRLRGEVTGSSCSHQPPATKIDAEQLFCPNAAEPAVQKEIPLKISARNQLKGTIVDVVEGATTSHIRIELGGGLIVTASITNEAVDELKLAKGKPATAVIKASDVMVAVD